MNYSSQKDYKAKMEKSGTFRKVNNYEVFGFNICMECQFYKAYKEIPTLGECQLMASNGCFNGVVYIAVCDKYIRR
jgi:hypothetical protein